MESIFVYITAASRQEAQGLATALLEARLIACANLLEPVHSMYWWEGNITSGTETVLICKSQARHEAEIVRQVKALHSYSTPCVVCLPVSGGNPDFLAWIAQETK